MRARRVLTITLALLVVAGASAGATLWFTRNDDGVVSIDSYRPVEGGLSVQFVLGIGDSITLARFEESDDRVVVTVRFRRSVGTYPAIGLGYEITASLERPLASRIVVDGSSGATVERLRG